MELSVLLLQFFSKSKAILKSVFKMLRVDMRSLTLYVN